LYFIHTENLGQVQKFWTSCISFIQKIWAGPEILDHLYLIHTENVGRSRYSGPHVFHSYRKCVAVQKFCVAVQKFCTRKSGSGPEILDQLYFIDTENLG
jgi:hypothetical protein